MLCIRCNFTQSVWSYTVFNFTRCGGNLRYFVARQYLKQIYALLSVKFSGLEICECKKNDKYQVWKTLYIKDIVNYENNSNCNVVLRGWKNGDKDDDNDDGDKDDDDDDGVGDLVVISSPPSKSDSQKRPPPWGAGFVQDRYLVRGGEGGT